MFVPALALQPYGHQRMLEEEFYVTGFLFMWWLIASRQSCSTACKARAALSGGSYGNLHPVRAAGLRTHSSPTRPEELGICHMDSFIVIALSLQRRCQRFKFISKCICCKSDPIIFISLWILAERFLPPSSQQLIPVVEFHEMC